MRPWERREKKPSTLGNDECVTRQHGRDVVAPPGIAATFEVVEPQLTLHILVGTFCAPPWFDLTDQPKSADVRWCSDEVEFPRCFDSILPFHQKPDDFSLRSRKALVADGKYCVARPMTASVAGRMA